MLRKRFATGSNILWQIENLEIRDERGSHAAGVLRQPFGGEPPVAWFNFSWRAEANA